MIKRLPLASLLRVTGIKAEQLNRPVKLSGLGPPSLGAALEFPPADGRARSLSSEVQPGGWRPPAPGQAGEEGGLLNWRERDDKPLASVELHVRV